MRHEALLAAGLLLVACAGCGGRHTPADADSDEGPGDADGDADSDVDSDVDGDADSDSDGDVDLDADGPDADEWDPTDSTWLMRLSHDWSLRVEVVAAVPGGDILVGGSLGGPPWVARLDPSGRLRWSWAARGGRPIEAIALGPGDRVFVSTTESLAELDLADGRLVWQASFGRVVHGLAALEDGSVVVAGRDMEVTRWSPDEGVLWRRRARGAERGSGASLAVTAEGTIFLAEVSSLARGTALAALDLDGELLWSGVLRSGLAEAVAATEEGGLVLAGRSGIWMARLDRDGGLEWQLIVGQAYPGGLGEDRVDEALAVASGDGGEVLAVGRSSTVNRVTGRTVTDVVAVWADRSGRLLRTVAVLPLATRLDSEGVGTAAAARPGGGWLVGGYFAGGGGDSILASLEPDGTVGGPCGYLVEHTFEPGSFGRVEPFEVTLEEGTMEPGPGDHAFEEVAPRLQRLCE